MKRWARRTGNGQIFPVILILCAVGAALSSCGKPSTVSLAAIDQLTPKIIEPGDVIRIKGSGFVEGPATVTFDGDFRATDLARTTRRTVSLEGNAISDEWVEIPMTASTLRRLTAQPTRFTGAVSVSFETVKSLGLVKVAADKEDVALDLRPAGRAIPHQARRERAATQFLSSLGMIMSTADELKVDQVVSSSRVDEVGVESGDRVLSVNGTTISNLAELADMVGQTQLRFELVSADGVMKTATIAVSSGAQLAGDEMAAIIFSSIALGLFLALVAPSRRRRSAQDAPSTDLLTRALGFALASIPLVLFPALAIVTKAGFGAFVLLFSAAALGLSALTLFAQGSTTSRLTALFIRLLPIPAALAIAGPIGSTISLWDLVASQHLSSWGWHIWSNPFALAAVITGMALIWPTAQYRSAAIPWLVGAGSWIVAIPTGMALTACCLGGWLIPGVPVAAMASDSWLLVLGVLVFFAKTWLVLFISRSLAAVGRVDRRAAHRGPDLAWRFVILVSTSTLALLWSTTALPGPLTAIGRVLTIATCATFFTALLVLAVKRVTLKSVSPLFERGLSS